MMEINFKQSLISVAHSLGLMKLIDYTLFNISRLKNTKSNKEFVKLHPEIALPPDSMIYSSFQLNYKSYYFGSLKSAEWIVNLAKPYVKINSASILDWGCGSGRIVRHIPSIAKKAHVFGADSNASSIEWCRKHIKNVDFEIYDSDAALSYRDSQFSFIYGVSTLTQFTEALQIDWINEIKRVLKKKGIFLLTTNGESFKRNLSNTEQNKFDKDELVIKKRASKGGHSTISFQSENFMRNLLKGFEVLAFAPGNVNAYKAQQDVWVVRKI